MPSAASAKLEKQASSNQAETSDNNNVVTPIRQALLIIDHKIRNLEKRKTKLETYRELQSSGKDLTSDQKAAVAKYDEVSCSLDFAREISKQMLQIATVAEKEQKKLARKETVLKAQAETAKIREVLTIQDILTHFTNSEVRDDFMNGSNGAVKLEEEDLTILEKFYSDIQVKRQSQPEDIPFIVGAQKSAEFLSMTIDGRPKQYGETTFENVRRILQSIQDCGYFDKAGKVDTIEEEIKIEDQATELAEAEDVPVEPSVTLVQESVECIKEDEEKINQIHVPPQSQPNVIHPDVPKFQSEAPAAAAVPAPTFPQSAPQPAIPNPQILPQAQLQRPLVPPSVAVVSQGQVSTVAAVPTAQPVTPIHAAHFPPTTVRAVEQTYYKQQYIQQMRPLADVIGSANFFFLQESELDSPDLVPSGFAPAEPQNQVPNIPPVSGNLAPQSPTATANLAAQQVVPQQIAMVQPGMQAKNPQAPTAAPIPSQTFTNQSFPNIVPPPAIFPQTMQNPEIPSSQPQLAVFAGAPIAIPQLVAQPTVVSQSQSTALPTTENLQPVISPHANQTPNNGTLITGPSGANVPLPCFSKVTMATPNPTVGIPQTTAQLKPTKDSFENVQTVNPVIENVIHNKIEESNERPPDTSNEWEISDQKKIAPHAENESNQWKGDVNNSNKTSNEWTGGYDNSNDSPTWNANQNEAYARGNGAPRGTGYSGNANRTGGGNRGSRSGQTTNNYRGRPNNSYPQQNGRNAGMNFRNNNENNYYQNQNGGYNNGAKDASGNFTGNGNNNYRLRGGPVSASNRQQSGGRVSGQGQTNSGTNPAPRSNSNPNRNNMGMSGGNNRPGRSNGGGNPANYGNSRPPNSVRQPQQDVNA